MKIRYSLTRWDLFVGQCLAMRFNRALPWFLAVVSVFIFYSSFTYPPVRDRSTSYKLAYSIGYMGFALGMGLMGGIGVTALNVILGKGKGLIGEHQLVLSDEGLEESTAFNRSLSTWAAMKKLKTAGNYYFLFVSDNNAHIVPKRGALLEGSLEPFMQEYRRRTEATQSARG